MAGKRSPTNRDAVPPRIDDLKLINGIGPGVEKRLNGVGIFTFAQLAALSPADIAAALADLIGLSSEHIIKQDWIGQAHKLAEESISSEAQKDVKATAPVEPVAPIEHVQAASPSAEPQKDGTPSLAGYQPATFTVELLLDENYNVQSTQVVHVQSRREYTWSNWPKEELLDFLSQSAGVNVPSDEQVLANTEEPVHAPVAVAESNPVTPISTSSHLTGTFRARGMEIVRVESNSPSSLLSHDEPFDARLTLDLSELQVPGNTSLNYKASIYGKGRGSHSGLVVGEAQGTIIPADTVTITVEGNSLPEGTYRLAAIVMLTMPDTKLTVKPGSTAVIDGGQVQVY